MKRLGDLYHLLRPHAAPHVPALLMVVVFGLGSAFLQKGPYVLLMPAWKALFPENIERVSDDDGEEPGAITRWLQETRASIEEGILGDPEVLAGDQDDPRVKAQRRTALIRVGVIVGVMALLAGITQYLMGVISGRVSLAMIVSLRMALARHLMGLSMRYHAGRQFGDLLSRISSDVQRTTQSVQLVLKDLVQEPLQFVVSILVALFISWKATVLVLVGLPLFVVPIGILLKKVRRSSHKSATELGSTFQVLTQMFQGVRTVKAYRAEERELDRFKRTNDEYVGQTMKMVRASTLSRAWTIFFTNFGIAVVVVVVGFLIVAAGREGADPSAMLTFFMMISQASSHLKRTTRVVAQISEAQGAAVRLNDLMDERPDVVEAPDARAISSLGDGIRFEGVTFEYPQEEGDAADAKPFALREIDLEVRPGETLALVGLSGSGKSTMLDLVARFVDPTAGRIMVGDTDLRELSFDSWTSHYALVTQSPFLFHASIGENIRYGRPGATDAEVEAAACAANIHDFIAELPEGYGTNVKDAGTRLSGGQRQRITIARALLRDPELLLLDEATSALDAESEAVVQAALDCMMRGRTTIVIAHRLSTIRGADRICVMDAGRIAEVGSHDELVASGGIYARLHGRQSEMGGVPGA